MSSFSSLTLAFEGWFDKSVCDLPDALRQRVEREFRPMSWDQLSAEERRTVALQLDYQHDPDMEGDRQLWWEFFERQDAVKAKIEQWEATATPTAGDLALKESKLAELHRDLARMEVQDRESSNHHKPARPRLNADKITSSISPVQYVAYPKALHQLTKRFKATAEELAAWVWLGPKDGGLAAFLNANELDPPPRFSFESCLGSSNPFDYLSPLMGCWFRADELSSFEPVDRYVTGTALLWRWANRPDLKPTAFIEAKVRESRLLDVHPICGGTQASYPGDIAYPMLTLGLYRLSEIEAIEAEDFDVGWQASLPTADPVAVPSDPVVAPVTPATVGPGIAGGTTSVPPSNGNVQVADRDTAGAPQGDQAGDCTDLAEMRGLAAEELCMAFVGDKPDDGMGANNMIEISTRQQTRRVALAALELVDRRHGQLNSLGVILLGMARGIKLKHSGPNATKMTRLRALLRKHLGLVGDPFHPHRDGHGWEPRFTILDKRGAADERAKRDAERCTESYEQLLQRGDQIGLANHLNPDGDDEGDAAASWLKENDPNGPK